MPSSPSIRAFIVVGELRIRTGGVGQQGLALALRHGLLRVEQGIVGRWPPEALIGVPPRAVRMPHRNPAVLGQPRVRQGRRLGPDGRHVGDLDDLRHRVVEVEQVPAVHEGIAVAVVLDLRTEQPAEPQQQFGLVGYLVHLRNEEEAAAGADLGAERFRLGFECRDRLRTGQRRELHRRAEARARERSQLIEPIGTARGGCREGAISQRGHGSAPVPVVSRGYHRDRAGRKLAVVASPETIMSRIGCRATGSRYVPSPFNPTHPPLPAPEPARTLASLSAPGSRARRAGKGWTRAVSRRR